jgi:hypothetical protein
MYFAGTEHSESSSSLTEVVGRVKKILISFTDAREPGAPRTGLITEVSMLLRWFLALKDASPSSDEMVTLNNAAVT